MNKLLLYTILATSSLGLLTGCDGGGGGGSSAKVGPDLQGKYVGVYFIRETTRPLQEITAKVSHKGERIIITTSLEGLGHKFTGRIDQSGYLWLTDQFDGEIWTTHEHLATEGYFEIEDYRRDISPTALAIMRLSKV